MGFGVWGEGSFFTLGRRRVASHLRSGSSKSLTMRWVGLASTEDHSSVPWQAAGRWPLAVRLQQESDYAVAGTR